MSTRALSPRHAESARPSLLALFAAALLRSASRNLAKASRQLSRRRFRALAAAEPVYEFYVEAGAPEGALYVDGQLVGHLHGVTRL